MDTISLVTYAQLCYVVNNLPVLLSTTTLGSTTASVTYSIATPYPRIRVEWNTRTSGAVNSTPLYLQMNGDNGANYQQSFIENHITSVTGNSSTSLTTQIQIGSTSGASGTSGYWGAGSFIINGANQSIFGPIAIGMGTAYVASGGSPNSYSGIYGGEYVVATPLTSVTLSLGAGGFIAGSSFSFYGLT